MATARGAGEAVLPAAVVRAVLGALVAEYELHEADRVGQGQREHEHASERHSSIDSTDPRGEGGPESHRTTIVPWIMSIPHA